MIDSQEDIDDGVIDSDDIEENRPDESREARLKEEIRILIRDNPKTVFYQRQLQVLFERDYFHWITARVLKDMREAHEIGYVSAKSKNNTDISIYFDKGFRFHKKSVKNMIQHVDEISMPHVNDGLGDQGEHLTLLGFCENGFKLLGASTNRLPDGPAWTQSKDNLDFIFEKDDLKYGVEVKNTLPYIEKKELRTKIKICEHLGICPVFVVRMMPKSYVYELVKAGGFALILKYQLFPRYFEKSVVASSVALGIPIKTPKKLSPNTMQRFIKWHNRRVSQRRKRQS